MLQQTEMAEVLLENLFGHLEQTKADIIATSNIGCQLYITRALKIRAYTARIVHPVVLLAAQLP